MPGSQVPCPAVALTLLHQCQLLSKEGQLDKAKETVSTSDSKRRKQEVNTSPSYYAWMIAIAGENLVVYQLGQKMEFRGRGFLEA
ncbi:Butyrophilin-Like Protein 8 [Manis pentadactyla]|nr:Butyrophilin-Like Protein 8 [Manis pentadactyla]